MGDLAGNELDTTNGKNKGGEIRYDNKAPVVTFFDIRTDNKLYFVARPGNEIRLDFTTDEIIKEVEIYLIIGGKRIQCKPEQKPVIKIFPGIDAYCGRYVLKNTDRDGPIGYELVLTDRAGNKKYIKEKSSLMSYVTPQFRVRDDFESN